MYGESPWTTPDCHFNEDCPHSRTYACGPYAMGVQQVFLEVCAVLRHGLRMPLGTGLSGLDSTAALSVVTTFLVRPWPQMFARGVKLGNPVDRLSCICVFKSATQGTSMSREAFAKPLKANMGESLIPYCICAHTHVHIYIYINNNNKQREIYIYIHSMYVPGTHKHGGSPHPFFIWLNLHGGSHPSNEPA